MSVTITLVALNPQPNTIYESVDFYVYDSVSTNLWLRSQSGIQQSASLGAIQSGLDANAAALLTAAQSDVPVASGSQALKLQWAAAHLVWRTVFVNAWWTLENGILTIPSLTLANYQALLQAAVNVINTLPAGFLTHFNNERTAQSLTMAVNTMTLAQCVSFDNLLHIWISSRLGGVDIAKDLSWFTSGLLS